MLLQFKFLIFKWWKACFICLWDPQLGGMVEVCSLPATGFQCHSVMHPLPFPALILGMLNGPDECHVNALVLIGSLWLEVSLDLCSLSCQAAEVSMCTFPIPYCSTFLHSSPSDPTWKRRGRSGAGPLSFSTGAIFLRINAFWPLQMHKWLE